MVISVGTKVNFKGDVGVVRYVGETQFAAGVWVGVELDQPNGKNDGSVKGERYFECKDKFGIFVKEPLLEVIETKTTGTAPVRKTRASLPNEQTPAGRSSSRLSSTVSSRAPSRASDGGPNDPNSESLRLRNIIQKLQDKLQVMKSDIEILRSQLYLVEAKNVELEDVIAKSKEDFEITTIDKETLEEQNVVLKQEIELLREQNSKIREQIGSLDQEAKSANNPAHQKLLNESKESLMDRNGKLEDALIKLRDHSIQQKSSLQQKIDELESKLNPLIDIEEKYEETSIKLIDAEATIADLKSYIETSIHSTEIIDTLTSENNTLTEENQKLKSTVQELEDLRKVGEELESFHVENTSNLQREVEKLKEQFEKQTIEVQDLEAARDNLRVKTIELENINKSLRQGTDNGATRHIEPSEATDLKRKSMQLQFDLLFAELGYKQQFISFLEELHGKSNSTAHYRDVLQLKSYADTYKLIAQYLSTDSSDLFINVLGIKLKFELLIFSESLVLLASMHQYAQSFVNLDIEKLDSITEVLIKQVKDQDFRDLPDFNELEHLLLGQLSSVTSSFSNYFTAKSNFTKELEATNSLLVIIGLISDDETADRFSIPKGSLSKLYQTCNTYKQKLEAALVKLQVSEGDHIKEITAVEIPSFRSQFNGFLERLSKLLATNASANLQEEVNVLLEFISNHSDDQLQWEVIDTEQSWALKNVKNRALDTKEVSSLQLDISNAHELSKQKDKQIEELNLKINVLSSRLNISKDTEAKLRKLKSEVINLNEMNDELNDRVINLTDSNQKMASDLQKAKTNSLLYNSEFESLYEQKQYTEKAELVSELHNLRNVVKTLTKKQVHNRGWLRVELPKVKPFEKKEADELRLIAKDLQRAVNNAKIYSITEGAK